MQHFEHISKTSRDFADKLRNAVKDIAGQAGGKDGEIGAYAAPGKQYVKYSFIVAPTGDAHADKVLLENTCLAVAKNLSGKELITWRTRPQVQVFPAMWKDGAGEELREVAEGEPSPSLSVPEQVRVMYRLYRGEL